MSALEPGREVDRYVVQGLLGEGGMAEVYRVRHATLGTLHALKVLTIRSRSVRERLVLEGRVQATLRHPNVVAVTDVLVIDGAPGLLMEFIEGPALDTWLRSYRPTLDEALSVFGGILAGVRSAHNKNLIHRDLKPANVLLHIEDGAVVPKVADFGLAKAVEGGNNQTRSGSTMGTPAYMAPEQIRDSSKVDQRADIFSLGCILYELVCGRQAFEGEDILELFNKIAEGDFVPPRSLVPDLPDVVEQAILGALELDPEERIASCKELQDVLEAVSADGPTLRMLTILPETAPGAQVARSLVTVSSFDDVPANSASKISAGKLSSDTWFGTGVVGVASTSRGNATTSSIAHEATVELQTELSQIRRQGMLMMGGTVAAAIALVFGVIVVAAGAVVYTIQQGKEDAPVVAVAAPVKPARVKPDTAAPKPPKAPPGVAPTATAPAATSPITNTTPPKVSTTPPKASTTPPKASTTPPKASTTPVAPPPTTGATIRLTGDARMVMLEGKAGRFRTSDAIPAGTYDVQAWFGAPNPVAAGRVTVAGNETIELKCVSLMAQCVRR